MLISKFLTEDKLTLRPTASHTVEYHALGQNRQNIFQKVAVSALSPLSKISYNCGKDHSFESENRHRIDAALEVSKSLPPISDLSEAWEANPWLLGAANGVIDLRTGRIREARQEDRITKFSPVRFDGNASCPRWLQFQNEIFLHDLELI